MHVAVFSNFDELQTATLPLLDACLLVRESSFDRDTGELVIRFEVPDSFWENSPPLPRTCYLTLNKVAAVQFIDHEVPALRDSYSFSGVSECGDGIELNTHDALYVEIALEKVSGSVSSTWDMRM